MKKISFAFILFIFISVSVFGQGFSEKMAQNLLDMCKVQEMMMQMAVQKQQADLIQQLLAKKIAVIVFFSENLQPDQIIKKLGLRDSDNVVQHVVDAYKESSQRQFHWLMEFSKTRDNHNQIQDIRLHELSQAASMKASVSAIRELSEQPNIQKICLYSQELTKPDAFFLRPEYYQIQNVSITPVENGFEKEVEFSAIQNSQEREVTPEQIINILKKSL